jgi:hypothetical protein
VIERWHHTLEAQIGVLRSELMAKVEESKKAIAQGCASETVRGDNLKSMQQQRQGRGYDANA